MCPDCKASTYFIYQCVKKRFINTQENHYHNHKLNKGKTFIDLLYSAVVVASLPVAHSGN